MELVRWIGFAALGFVVEEERGGVWALEVEGKKVSEKGWVSAATEGVEDVGVLGAAALFAGCIEIVRMLVCRKVLEEDVGRLDMRASRVRRQEEQIIVAA